MGPYGAHIGRCGTRVFLSGSHMRPIWALRASITNSFPPWIGAPLSQSRHFFNTWGIYGMHVGPYGPTPSLLHINIYGFHPHLARLCGRSSPPPLPGSEHPSRSFGTLNSCPPWIGAPLSQFRHFFNICDHMGSIWAHMEPISVHMGSRWVHMVPT